MSGFPAVVANNVSLFGLLCWILDWQIKLRVHEFTLWTLGAETAQIVDTHHASCVPMTTVGPMSAEPSIIPRAILDLGFWVDVKKWAFLVAASIKARIEVALRHLCHVVLVEEFTLVALFTKPTKPVLAHNRSISFNMPERAC